MSDFDFLRMLDKEAWKTSDCVLWNNQPIVRREKIDGFRFSLEQWNKITEIFHRHSLMAEMRNTDFGFAVLINIYIPGQPIYPYASTDPELLLSIHCKQIPEEIVKSQGNYKDGFDQWFTILSEFSHTDYNAEHLKWHGIDGAKQKEKYRY